MLQTIREHTQGWIAGTIITVIILTFALWGIHSYFVSGGNNSVVAEVNNTNITREQLSIAYERLKRQVQAQYHSNIPTALKDESALKAKALQSLIEVEVLKQAAHNQGFHIANAQVDGYLESMPEFQVNGEFSVDRFQEMLASTSLSTGEFLDLIHTSLLIDQPKLGIVFSSFSMPEEINYTISLVNQERDINYLTLPLQRFLKQANQPSAESVQAYYQAHQADFMTPEQVKVEYLELSLKSLQAKINPNETALKNFYTENLNAYTTTGAGQEPKIQVFETVKSKVKDAYIRQHAEEKFAEMRDQLADLTYEHPESLQTAASALSLPILTTEVFTKNKGGSDISQYKKVRDIAFGNEVLNVKNNSDVIQINPETLIVLRVKNHVPSALLPLKDVQAQIQDKLKKAHAEQELAQFAEKIQHDLQAGQAPEQIAKTYQLTWTKSGFIGRYSNKVDTAILDQAFRLPNPASNQQTASYGVALIPNGYAVIALKSVKNGLIADKKEYDVFAEQVQNSQGLLEYELYKQSQVKAASITTY